MSTTDEPVFDFEIFCQSAPDDDIRRAVELAGEDWAEISRRAAAEGVRPGWVFLSVMIQRNLLWGPGPFNKQEFEAELARREVPQGLLTEALQGAILKAFKGDPLRDFANEVLRRCFARSNGSA